MAKIGNLGVDLTLESATFTRDLGKVAANLSSSATKMNRSLATFDRQVKQVQRSLSTFERAVTTAIAVAGAAAFTKMSTSALDVAASFEQMEIKLNALTKGRGKETLEELNAWALEMPVNTQKAVSTFSMMTAMGLNPTIEKMQILVDVGAIFGEETMPQIARQMGQISAKGRIMSQDLNVIAEAGVNARKYLKQAFGMTVEELQNSGIEIERILDAIWNGLNADYGGAAKAAMTSWQGLTAVLKSYIIEIQRTAMNAGIFDALKGAISGVNEELKSYIENNGEMLRQDVAGYVNGVVGAMLEIQSIYSALPSGVVGAAGAGLVGRVLFGGWGAAKLVAALVFINAQMEQLGQGLSEFKQQNDRLGDAMSNIWDVITGKRNWNTGQLQGAAADMLALQKAAERSSAAMQGIVMPEVVSTTTASGGGGASVDKKFSSSQLAYMTFQGAQLNPDWFQGMPDAAKRAAEMSVDAIETVFDTEDAWFVRDVEKQFLAAEDAAGGWLEGMRKGFDDYQTMAEDTFNNSAAAFNGVMMSMEDALVQFVSTGKFEFSSLIQSILADLARLTIRESITGPLSKLLSGSLSTVFSANGNVLQGGFQAFANGGLVTSPTLGIVGEGRYNEAVVPLPDGRSIPVEFSGSGGGTTNVYYISAVDAQSFEERFRGSIAKVTAEELNDNNGALWQALGRR